MIKFFIWIGIPIIIHATYNLINYYRFNKIKELFYGIYSDDTIVRDNSISNKNVIVNYIKNAGVPDKIIPVSQTVGYGFVANSSASILKNIICNRQDIASSAYELLLEAKGNYWSRFVNSINPFYWFRIILFIPKYIFSYLGIKSDNIFVKIFQLIYWIIGVAFTFLISVYPTEIKAFIDSIIHIH